MALARILIYEPDVIMLDEPFSALDFYLKEQMQFQVLEVMRAYRGDALLVTHSRDEVYRFCEKSIILNRGRVAMEGGTREIFRDPVNVTAARLTGCKNISRVERVDANHIRALNWGPCPGDGAGGYGGDPLCGDPGPSVLSGKRRPQYVLRLLGRHAAPAVRVGHPAKADGAPETAEGENLLWWKIDYTQLDRTGGRKPGDTLTLGVRPEDILLLREG